MKKLLDPVFTLVWLFRESVGVALETTESNHPLKLGRRLCCSFRRRRRYL